MSDDAETTDGIAHDSPEDEGHPAAPDLDAMFEAVGDVSPPDDVSSPNDDGAPFSAPWQARAFGLAVALTEREGHDREAFHDRFVERLNAADPAAVQADVEGAYYERWLDALEATLLEAEVLTETELERRAAEFTEGERDASEFVVEDPTG